MLFRGFSLYLVFLLFSSFLAAADSDLLVNRLRQEIIGTRENDPARNKRLAEILERQGFKEEALVYYQRATENAPDSVSCKLALARSLGNLGKIDETIRVYEEILKIEPNNERCADEMICFLESAGKVEEAEAFHWKLVAASKDTPARLSAANRLIDFAVRHRRTDHLLNDFQTQNCFSSSAEKAIFLSQIYLQLGRKAEAYETLKEELSAALARDTPPAAILLDRLIHYAKQEEDIKNALEYSRILYRFYPTAENRHELEILENLFQDSPQKQYEYFSSHPDVFLDSLLKLLSNPQTRNEAASFAVSFLPKIPPEQLASSAEGIRFLFTNLLFPYPEKWEKATELWHTLWNHAQTHADSASLREELLRTLIGVPPQLGKIFAPELIEQFTADPESDLFWEGYWSPQGWESLWETLLQSESDALLISALERKTFDPSEQHAVQRAILTIDFHRGDFSKAWENLLSSGLLDVPKPETLYADWTLLREMENDPLPSHQETLARLYRDRLPLVAGSPEEKFILLHYRKAVLASWNALLIEEAAAPLLETLERYFELAEQADDTGNVHTIDSKTGKNSDFNIYEILNTLLDTAIELKSLGLSDKTAALYHQYGEGKKWWTDLDGQGVFYFEELKKIIEEAE